MKEEIGYSPKELSFGEKGRMRLIRGITKIADAVRSTLGPRGNTVLIESVTHTHGITVTKDGVTVAKSIDLLDPVENLAVKIMKEAAERTSTAAGDGTTTAIILAEALALVGFAHMTEEVNRTKVLRYLDELSESVINQLKTRCRDIDDKMLLDVATISSNNDYEIGHIIAEAYNEVGKDGIVTVENSQTTTTYAEVTSGMRVQRGFTSSLFINDQKRDECVFEDTYILVCDTEIGNLLSIENVLKPIIQQGKRLLIIAPCTNNVVNTLAANVMRNNLKLCNISPPSFGYKQHELMQDIAVSVGAKYFSEKTGDNLSLISFADLGHASKVVVGRNQTIILNDERDDNAALKVRVNQIRDAIGATNNKEDKDFLYERLAMLVGGIGVIYVGGNTDLEQKELYDRVDDAVCAVRSALQEGVVAGGGVALYNVSLIKDNFAEKEYNIAVEMMMDACQTPVKQILDNAGIEFTNVYTPEMPTGHGFDVKTGLIGDMFEMGIVDPMKVTRLALINAVSVASTILSTDAIITLARSYDTKGVWDTDIA